MTRSTLVKFRDWLGFAAAFVTVLFLTLSSHRPDRDVVRPSADVLTLASADEGTGVSASPLERSARR